MLLYVAQGTPPHRWLRWKTVPTDVDFGVAVEGNLEDLVGKVGIATEFGQCFLEQLDLHVQVHTLGSIETHQAGMKHYVSVLPARAWSRRRTAKIDRILSDE